ncbi:abortive infection family protein [Acinetobacter sp. COS3]|uniref:abortive infection family protein n=1 Tax=Acinetobacter sp. COS3 TaxID=1397525 RepID=UPI0003B80BF0|nr:abortive infection family protein [Acinetobacter sp. COS3]ERS03151.1 hypothetical protein Q674_10820 [Acinetobacter sp. COS3]
MNNIQIPNSVIGAVASVISNYYYSHSKLDSLFMESGAPGETPLGNCEQKCSNWLKRCNEDPNTNALDVLGKVIQDFMDKEETTSIWGTEPLSQKIIDGRKRISDALSRNQLTYNMNGYIVQAGSTPITRTLEDYLKSGDFSSIEKEFERALENIQTDPHAAITAACSIIEATFKNYIENFSLPMPNKLSVKPLWDVVKPNLELNRDDILASDQQKILQGISSIIDGVGSFRSHIGSAHGRGSNPPNIVIAEARLAVNAAHTLVIFIMEIIFKTKFN